MNDDDTRSYAPAAPPDVAEMMVCTMSDWLLRAEVIQLGLASALNQVAALLDHLELDSAVVGGTSLGATAAVRPSRSSPRTMALRTSSCACR